MRSGSQAKTDIDRLARGAVADDFLVLRIKCIFNTRKQLQRVGQLIVAAHIKHSKIIKRYYVSEGLINCIARAADEGM